MRNLLIKLLFILVTTVSFAQSKGTVSGAVQDKDMGLEPVAFASVYVKEKPSIGTTTDFDGNYKLQIPTGNYTLVFEFVGYKKVQKPVVIKAGASQKINVVMESQADALEAVVLTAVTNKESETALLEVQKEKVEIIESIGAQQLSKAAVSNAAAATTKITGVNKNESSGDIYIRGLGDRYLFTTMNGLPIPSDDIEKKNIDLNLFPTSVIQSVGISKTYSTSSYADQTSGHVDIATKVYSKSSSRLKIGLSGGINSNVAGQFGDFYATANKDDISALGFYNSNTSIENSITESGWNRTSQNLPLNFGISASGGFDLELGDTDLEVVLVGSHGRSFKYREETQKNFKSNILNEGFVDDIERFESTITTNLLADVNLVVNNELNFRISSWYLNKVKDVLYERGRKLNTFIDKGPGIIRTAFVFDQEPVEDGFFQRDQNLKQTNIFVNQFSGAFKTEKNDLKWAVGYNVVNANEPHRIRNNVNIGLDEYALGEEPNTPIAPGQIVYPFEDLRQRKSTQEITDNEVNAYLKDKFFVIDEDDKSLNVEGGLDYRRRTRDFSSQVIGIRRLRDNGGLVGLSSIDNMGETFTQANLDNGLFRINEALPDTYEALLDIKAVYVGSTYKFGATTLNAGLRFESDLIDLDYDVANAPGGRLGNVEKEYNNVFPHLNLKHELNEKHSLRLALSKTITLPEFKEIAPFEYVSPTGRVTQGNADLEPSENYNADIKWEYFMTKSNLISLASFYKRIKNPINYSILRSAGGNFTYNNTGEAAQVIGAEFETRYDIFDSESLGNLNANLNVTYMYHNQDLKEEFTYKDVTESKLQGAPDYIINSQVSYSDNKENEFVATLSGNYTSDKIYSLGTPSDQNFRATQYNDEIIEKGFITLDFAVSKKINENLSIKGSVKNLLNPSVDQTQKVGVVETVGGNEVVVSENNELVQSYKNGVNVSLGISYKF